MGMRKAEKAKLLLAQFPEVPEEIMQQLRSQVGHYLLYNKHTAVCTHCGYSFQGDNSALNHGEPVECGNCGRKLTAMRKHCRYAGHIDRNARNFVVFQAKDGGCYVNCIRMYHNLENKGNGAESVFYSLEDQRYAFADGIAYRFGRDVFWSPDKGQMRSDWKLRTRYTEPVMDPAKRGYNYADNSYIAIHLEHLRNSGTCLQYAEADRFVGDQLFTYIQFYLKHPNVEYLMKIGLEQWVSSWFQTYHYVPNWIDWAQNDVRKMLGMNSYELREIRTRQISIADYHSMKEELPSFTTEECLRYVGILKHQRGTLERHAKSLKAKRQLFKYLYKQNERYADELATMTISNYDDYIRECKELQYDMKEPTVLFPRCLAEAHQRTSHQLYLLREEQRTEQQRKWKEQRDQKLTALEAKQSEKLLHLREQLAYQLGDLLICVPKSFSEIITEGAVLNHCVGGYAKRHAEGKLHILFIRRAEKPDVPFYTMELSADGQIQQVQGRKNANPTPVVQALVDAYTAYLQGIFNDKKKARKSA